MLDTRLSKWLAYGGIVTVFLGVAVFLPGGRTGLLYVGLAWTVSYLLGALVLSYTRCRSLELRKRQKHDVDP